MTFSRMTISFLTAAVGMFVTLAPLGARPQSRQGNTPRAGEEVVDTTTLIPDDVTDDVWPGLQLQTLKNGKTQIIGRREGHVRRADGVYYQEQRNDSVFVDRETGKYRIFRNESPADRRRIAAYLTSRYGVSEEQATKAVTVPPAQERRSYGDYFYSSVRRNGPRRLARLSTDQPTVKLASAVMQDGGGYGWECRGSASASIVTRDIIELSLTNTISDAGVTEGEQCDYYTGYCYDYWYGSWGGSFAASQPSSAGTYWYVDWPATWWDGSSIDWALSYSQVHAYYWNTDFNDFFQRVTGIPIPQLYTEVGNHTSASAYSASGYQWEYGEQISGYANLLHFDSSGWSDGGCWGW